MHKNNRQEWCAAHPPCSCFVDFLKAFDSVSNAHLWQVLAERGLGSLTLSVVISTAAHDKACVLRQAGLTESFDCTSGVQRSKFLPGPLAPKITKTPLQSDKTGQTSASNGLHCNTELAMQISWQLHMAKL